MSDPRPHDLLRITVSHSDFPDDMPDWAHDALARTPWVVVRRALPQQGHYPVGVRGITRSQRYAMTVRADAVTAVVTPELLGARELSTARRLPALDALRELQLALTGLGLRWGPTGAVGYELATGSHAVHAESDLDLAVYADGAEVPTRDGLGALDHLLRQAAVRVDCLVEYPWGAVALDELASGADPLMVRSAHGPRLLPAQSCEL